MQSQVGRGKPWKEHCDDQDIFALGCEKLRRRGRLRSTWTRSGTIQGASNRFVMFSARWQHEADLLEL
jgi:hypothetical protein